MRIDLIDDHAQLTPMRLSDERVEISERTEDGIDIAIIGNVIAEVLHR